MQYNINTLTPAILKSKANNHAYQPESISVEKNLRSTNLGFTIIELLVVISIVSLLASIVLSSVKSARDQGALLAYTQNMTQLANAIELYYEANGNYPSIQYDTLSPAASANSWESLTALLTPYASQSSLLQKGKYASVAQFSLYTPFSLIVGPNCVRTVPSGNGFFLIGFLSPARNQYTLNDGGISPDLYEIFRGTYSQGVYAQDPQTGIQTCGQ